MTAADYGVLLGCVSSFFAVILFHERREFRRGDQDRLDAAKRYQDHETNAMYRERRAMERHEIVTAELKDNRHTFLGIIHGAAALTKRIDWLEEAVENHGEHLEVMGRPDVHKPSRRKGGR